LTLKGNHPLAHAAVVEHFDQQYFRHGATSRADCDAFDGTHGRLVRRRAACVCIPTIAASDSGFFRAFDTAGEFRVGSLFTGAGGR